MEKPAKSCVRKSKVDNCLMLFVKIKGVVFPFTALRRLQRQGGNLGKNFKSFSWRKF